MYVSVLVYQNTDRKLVTQDVKTLQCDEHHRDFPAEKTRHHHRICYGFTGYNRTCIGFNGNCNCPCWSLQVAFYWWLVKTNKS